MKTGTAVASCSSSTGIYEQASESCKAVFLSLCLADEKKRSFLDKLNNEPSPLPLESEVAGCMGAILSENSAFIVGKFTRK